MSKFTWGTIYREIAVKIIEDTVDIKNILENCDKSLTSYLSDKNNSNNWMNLDLFTFFGSFNRSVRFKNRIKILQHIKDRLELEFKIPSDFDGIPTMDNRNSWFQNNEDDKNSLNILFKEAVTWDGESDINFDSCLEINGVGLGKLTTGLFWINSDKFMPIAGPVIAYLKRKFPNFEYSDEKGSKAWDKIFNGMKWEQYEMVLEYLKDNKNNKKSFKELSLESIESSVENEILENNNVLQPIQ